MALNSLKFVVFPIEQSCGVGGSFGLHHLFSVQKPRHMDENQLMVAWLQVSKHFLGFRSCLDSLINGMDTKTQKLTRIQASVLRGKTLTRLFLILKKFRI